MAKMHELLAVESDRKGQFKTILEESKKVFKGDHNLFLGFHRKLTTFDEQDDDSKYPVEQKELGSTVPKRLDYTAKYIVKFLDVQLQKEATNQSACSDLIVNDEVIAENVPATFLLSLEKNLKEIRDMYSVIPTLPPNVAWDKAEELGADVYRMKEPEEKLRTEKKFMSQILYEATKEHPAQIEKWEEQIPTGKYIKNVWSGMITSAEKSRLLGNIDKLISAAKKARQRANNTEVVKQNIGQKLVEFINNNE